MEETKGIDIFQLGKKEEIVKIIDPSGGEDYSLIRLVKMNKKEAGECFAISRNASESKKKHLLLEESTNKVRSAFAANLQTPDVIEMLVAYEKSEMLVNIDLLSIADEKDMSKEDLKVAQDVKVKEWEINRSKEMTSEKEEALREKLVQRLIDTEAIAAGNMAFVDAALGYTCYLSDKDERIFSSDPSDQRHVSNLRDERIYGQISAAFHKFTQVFAAALKDIRAAAGRGSDFTISTKSQKDATGSPS
ncbi:MAG: hypothetical protein NTY10_04320 [Candidatus Omnitrophica bacterium]|nr:hypothetical protein [Candidatus Omnitrophota bacterium]